MILLHEILCLALFYSVFCRAVKMNGSARSDIRIALQAMGTVAAIGIAVPVHWPSWSPDWFDIALLSSITTVQAVTAYHWRTGMPTRFQKPYTGPERRLPERRET